MGVSTEHVVHAIVTPNATYSQITDSRVNPGIQMMHGFPAGHPEPLFSCVADSRPEVTFVTTQIDTVLGEATAANMFCADLSGGNTDLYLRQVASNATRIAAATSAHTRLRASNAMMVLQSISAPHNAEATANVRLLCIYDGTNEPIVPTGSTALSGTSAANSYFCAGPVAINGSAVPGVQQIDIDFGHTLIESGGDGEVWWTFAAVQEIRPSITIRTLTATSLTSLGIVGSALASFVVYLRKYAENGTRIANGTEQHIAFAGTSGIVTVDEVSGGGNEPVMTMIRITPTAADADNRAIAVDTAAAIE